MLWSKCSSPTPTPGSYFCTLCPSLDNICLVITFAGRGYQNCSCARTYDQLLPARLAGVMAGRIHSCRVAGNTVWQVTLRSSVMGFPLRAVLGFNLSLTFYSWTRACWFGVRLWLGFCMHAYFHMPEAADLFTSWMYLAAVHVLLLWRPQLRIGAHPHLPPLQSKPYGHKPGILSDFSEHGKLREFSGNSVQPQGKIVTNKSFFSLSFKYLCKTAVDWVNRIIRE